MWPQAPRILRVPLELGEARPVMHVHDWGDLRNPEVVVCVHGLTRNGRDFDLLAQHLSSRYRVLCPDVPGRGESDWLPSVADYCIPVYARSMQQMLVQEGIERCHWVGTSMGGLIGLAWAALPDTPLQSFVINDVGPEIERAALERIAGYIRARPSFATYPELFAAAFPAILPFGPLTDEQRHHLIRTSCERRADGRWHFRTDPKIGEAFVAALAQPSVDLWPLWQAWSALARPTLILRGEHSDLFSPACMQRMLKMHPKAQALVVRDTGHAPMLMDEPTIQAIADFLSHAVELRTGSGRVS